MKYWFVMCLLLVCGTISGLVKHTFFRIHKSFIINLHEVSKYVRGEGGHVVMTNDAVVPVSRLRKDEFLKIVSR
jgi:two-component system LytT family response regulator